MEGGGEGGGEAAEALGERIPDEDLHDSVEDATEGVDDGGVVGAGPDGELEAGDEVEGRAEPIDVKVRDFLKVRRKETCPRCGGKIRTAGVRGMDAWFCPRCQPASRPGFVDWTRAGK